MAFPAQTLETDMPQDVFWVYGISIFQFRMLKLFLLIYTEAHFFKLAVCPIF